MVLAIGFGPWILWLRCWFLLPFYTVLAVAFGTVDPVFRQPLPVYQPWWWSFSTFNDTLHKFYGPEAIYQARWSARSASCSRRA